uniref:Olfactory receptor n=1 Tax=Leptobrachium leishanense TaxID=445787 RepID=A0A8C5Q803_9ANUR
LVWKGQNMAQKNGTQMTEFILLGFSTETQPLLFGIFVIIYIFTFIGNLSIILIVTMDPILQSPMYLFLRNLSIIEIFYISVTVPRMLKDFLQEKKAISIMGCAAQFYFFCCLGATECFTLAFMAYDRYVAICHPLHYMSIMTKRRCLSMSIASWLTGMVLPLTIFIFRLTFCGPNVINHFFCDISPLLNLSCTDLSFTELVDFILAMVVIMIPLVLIIITYVFILWTVLRIPNNQGRQKTFSTCASHLTIVIIFYTTTLFIYARPRKANPFDSNKLVTVFYSVVTPLLNPIIYCLRNKEVKLALKKTFRWKDFWKLRP